ncbi:hypothetical protein BC332_28384 [Capsicum chinense]|nr:hypothetical protein BC332_28384 [Capsicum chinense]
MVAIGLSIQEPVDEAFGKGVDLVRWVHGASARGETPEQILDAKFSTISFAWRKEMVATLKVALICTDAIPAKRPRMKKLRVCNFDLHIRVYQEKGKSQKQFLLWFAICTILY